MHGQTTNPRSGGLALLLTAAACAGPAGRLKIYINTDLEGASGVYKFAQTREPGTPLNREACEYLMGDIAAVVRGLREAGAAEIVVLDGHGSQAVVPHLHGAGGKYITGMPRSGPLTGLDSTFHGMVLLGFHAMMGTPDGVLHHTQSSKSENRYWYNGVESGELAQSAAIAGHFGVPPIMVTGDEATCREARKFFGETLRDGGRQAGARARGGRALSVRGNAPGAVRGRETGRGRHPRLQALHA